jgi:hypothetical protein
MYAIFAGAGCSHGVPGSPNAVIRINPDHSPTRIADLGAFLRTHPLANPTDPVTGDFEPDGTWYSMIALRGDLYAVEPNHGELDKITTDGKITRVIDVSASQGHVVPTVVAYHGVFYLSNLGRFDPDQLNTQSVFQITPSGKLKVVATGLSKVLGLAFDGRDRMYVLELRTRRLTQVPNRGLAVLFAYCRMANRRSWSTAQEAFWLYRPA